MTWTQSIGAVDLTDQGHYTVESKGTPHRRPKTVDTASDWPLRIPYVVSVTGDTHAFEMDVIVWGASSDDPTRTIEDAQDDFNAIVDALEAADNGETVYYIEQWTARTTSDVYAVLGGGTFEEEDRDDLVGSFIRGRLKFTAVVA